MQTIVRSSRIGDIVARDIRTAAVFERYGLDFCCGGQTPLADACREHEIDLDRVLDDLRAVDHAPEPPLDVTSWPVELVIERIVGRHHAYVRRHIPEISSYLDRLVRRHGDRHPVLTRLAVIFSEVSTDLLRHMEKEELLLFPYIEALAAAERTDAPRPDAPFGSVSAPIAVMQDEHVNAAAELWRLRGLTNGYEVPEDGCATWRACYDALDAFERDLRTHVHLENNVLFPAALRLERALAPAVQ